MQKFNVPRYIQWLVVVGLFYLVVMLLLRLAFVFSFHHTVLFSDLGPSFLLGLRFDLRVISIVVLILFILGCFKILHPFHKKAGQKTSFIILGIFSFLLSFFYIIDFSFYAYLSQRLSGSILNYAEDAAISMSMVWQTYPVVWLVLSLIGGIILLMWVIKKAHFAIAKKYIQPSKPARIGWGITFFLLLAIAIFGRVGQYPLRWSDAFALGNDYKSQVALNPFQSFFSSLSFRHSTFDLSKVTAHYDLIADYLSIPNPNKDKLNFDRLVTPLVPDGYRPPNIVLVICESFSAYKSSMVDNPLNTTPFFNGMVKKGIYFDRCFSPTYGTAKGVWAIVTGTPEVQLNSTASRNPAAVDQHTIINDFKGYEKYYFLGGSTSWANIRGLLTNNIKNLHLYEEGDYKAAKIDVWGISDKNLFLESNKTLSKEKKPFFAIIQTADNHRPYTIPSEDKNEFKVMKLPADTLVKYGFENNEEYNAFRYTDFTFQKFMTAASKEAYFKNTIFVFIGDHGIYGNAKDMLPTAFTNMRLTAEHIPLLFYAPTLIQPARFSFAVSQIDVLPTIAGLVKINYLNTSLGRDLLQPSTQQKEGAYIIDVDQRNSGFIRGNLFYNKNMNSNQKSIGYLNSNIPITFTDSINNAYEKMTDALYETSRYLLLNNKKKQ